MRPLTYFAFTILSVVIQFGVMDFIQGNIESGESPIYFNETASSKPNSIGVLKDYSENAHALYYRLNQKINYGETKDLSKAKYRNSQYNLSHSTTTGLTFTVYDILYDENISTTDGASTLETFYTSTELDNVTETSLLDKNTSSTVRPSVVERKARSKVRCYCDLLYKLCDINCCCDDDCSEADKELFGKCKNLNLFDQIKQHWYQPLTCSESDYSAFDNLFCIAKINLPDKQVVVKQKTRINKAEPEDTFLWNDGYKEVNSYKFDRKFYKYGDPVWLLRNKSVYHFDLPAPITNNYCSNRRPMKYLKNEEIQCQVKLKELEMFRVLKMIDESSIISVANHSLNNTAMNCASLYCTNWTVIYCSKDDCLVYNKSLHQPICTEYFCRNLALRLEYIFNVYDSKIVNATVKLYAQKVPTFIHYLTQKLDVKFYLGNSSIERVVKLSGNPGYVEGLPVIASFALSNHTDNFYNSTSEHYYLIYPENKDGVCTKSKNTKKILQFGFNKRMKCRISLKLTSSSNGTEACLRIQSDINKIFSVDNRVYLSPYGNPYNVKDDDWLPIQLKNKYVHGEFYSQTSKLQCYNIQTRIGFILTYADVSDSISNEQNKLLSAKVDGSATNVSLSTEDFSTVITVDINFVNVNKLRQQDFAGPPHLNLNLPKNFFFPFPRNECHSYKSSYMLLIHYICIITFLTK